MLYLNIPYSEKEDVKKLGAQWDPKHKKWYVKYRNNYPKFNKWIVGENSFSHVLFEQYYIVVGNRKCYRCKKPTNVITFAAENSCTYFYPTYEDNNKKNFIYNNNQIHLYCGFSPIEKKLKEYLFNKYNYHIGYSHTIKREYLANHCQHCGSLQGDFFIYNEVESPFFLDSEEKVKNLIFYKIPLKEDLIVSGEIDYMSLEYNIRDLANFVDLDI